jgi:hypothetical protein
MMPLWVDLYEDEDDEDALSWAMEQDADEPYSHFQFDPDLLGMTGLSEEE